MTTIRSEGTTTDGGEGALEELKRTARLTWATGDYATIAARELWAVGEWIVKRLAIRPGDDVVDIGCGTGNAAIRAALAGARTVGIDLTPVLLATAGELATQTGVEVDWREGDAENLPAKGESFDVVVSTFGCMFAPRHEVAAREIARVLRPGGRMGLCSWPVDGALAQIMKTIAKYVPRPPAQAAPPWLWGSEQHVRDVFDGTGVELEFECNVIEHQPFESAEADVEFHSTRFGPLIRARAITEADGRWERLRAELLPLHRDRSSLEYFVTLGHKG